mmetsp:Transcript_11850/g.44077  ORF Transcript_11850/g.44077 Transcript_11850/m.44077 type:complete len:260 (-) Transcript_11850:567-1346(-)
MYVNSELLRVRLLQVLLRVRLLQVLLRVCLLQVLRDCATFEHRDSRVWVLYVRRLEHPPFVEKLLAFRGPAAARFHQMRKLQLHQFLAHQLTKRRGFVGVHRDWFRGHRRGCVSAPGAHPRRQAETRGEYRKRPRAQKRRYVLLPRAVRVVQVVDDVVALVHFDFRVRVHHVREHGFAAPLFDLFAKVGPPLRTRIEKHIKVQPNNRLPDLLTERTALELVQLELDLRPRKFGHVGSFFHVPPPELPERVRVAWALALH